MDDLSGVDYFDVGGETAYDFGDIGPQTDGTYDIPATALQVNDPSNTAGYPSSSDDNLFSILKYGVGAATDVFKFKSGLDYKRFEATQGGLFEQGRTSVLPRIATGGISTNYILIAAAAVGLFLLLTHRNG